MKKIILLGAAPIDGEMRFPSAGEIEVSPAVAQELIDVGLAKDASLSNLSADEVREVAADERVDLPPTATKAEAAEAIRERRKS